MRKVKKMAIVIIRTIKLLPLLERAVKAVVYLIGQII